MGLEIDFQERQTKAFGLTTLFFLSRAHRGNRRYRFPNLVPAADGLWTIDVDFQLAL